MTEKILFKDLINKVIDIDEEDVEEIVKKIDLLSYPEKQRLIPLITKSVQTELDSRYSSCLEEIQSTNRTFIQTQSEITTEHKIDDLYESLEETLADIKMRIQNAEELLR